VGENMTDFKKIEENLRMKQKGVESGEVTVGTGLWKRLR